MSKTYATTGFSTFSGPRADRPALLRPASLLTLLLTWQQRASDRNHLAQLADRELADVGLTRADLALEVSKHFWRA